MIFTGAVFEIKGLTEIDSITDRFKPEFWFFQLVNDTWYLVTVEESFDCVLVRNSFAELIAFEDKVKAKLPEYEIIGSMFITNKPIVDYKELIEDIINVD
ncbi:hypothetical protein [Bacteroides sp.]|uniref:hypothetical protein n=1 Tax=Bacteroides sp. TaxID=29523 RepID=UPI00261B8521|nr:hypothetical protein [Bacteroides sp.]MDD3039613.1 hypothetical protein [Bacteroides sp.]